MAENEKQFRTPAGIQVFELTMDNPEDQDELNRRLRKPSEAEKAPGAKAGSESQAKPQRER